MADVIKYRFRCRRRTAAQWTAVNEILLDSEIGLEDDTGLGKIGDGVTAWNNLLYTIVGRVDLSGLADGKILKWSASGSKWVLADAISSPLTTKGDIFTFDTAAARLPAGSDGMVPVYDSTKASGLSTAFVPALALKGRVSTYINLPSTGNVAGDAYLNDDDGLIYIWDGTAWPAFGYGWYSTANIAKPLWWRLKVTATNGGASYTVILEIEMATSPSGANLCAGRGSQAFGTTYAAANYWSNCFDGYKSAGTDTGKYTATIQATSSAPVFIGTKLAAGAKVTTIRLTGCPVATQVTFVPKDFTIQSSTDSTTGLDGTWTDEWSVTGQTGWTAGEERTFNKI